MFLRKYEWVLYCMHTYFICFNFRELILSRKIQWWINVMLVFWKPNWQLANSNFYENIFWVWAHKRNLMQVDFLIWVCFLFWVRFLCIYQKCFWKVSKRLLLCELHPEAIQECSSQLNLVDKICEFLCEIERLIHEKLWGLNIVRVFSIIEGFELLRVLSDSSVVVISIISVYLD